ncbi:MAG: glucose-1-phosphate adenylyltransferase [Firmicutes bacterium]|nr:glucose-1-phosphate adenylyltransferase [Bacillota bacterium]
MIKFETVTMILAGGQGSRLGVLTKTKAKPAVQFGGKYKIIDFAISNCINSNLECLGILTQYKPHVLNSHIGVGHPWDLDRNRGGVTILPPYMEEHSGRWYLGTADAITQNLDFIGMYSPEYVLILSGDHIYKMDYLKMIEFHRQKKADATISVYQVPIEQASSFGVMNTWEDYSIYEFEEKPKNPKSDLISMGIYIFNWKKLKQYLLEDAADIESAHDFGKNVIPKMLRDSCKLYAYPFEGYWKDVGTVEAYWESNMDLLERDNQLKISDSGWKIYSRIEPAHPTHFVSQSNVKNSIVGDGSLIYGTVVNSIISPGVVIEEGAEIRNSIIMPNCHIQKEAKIDKAILDYRVKVGSNVRIGAGENIVNQKSPHIYYSGITVAGTRAHIPSGTVVGKNVMIDAGISYKDYSSTEIKSGESVLQGGEI